MKVLFINGFELPDFQSDMVFHGIRSLLGEDCVDSTEAWYMYDDFRKHWTDRVPERGMSYGRGFTLYGRLPKLNIDRTDLEAKITNHYFDKIIYGSSKRYLNYFNIAQIYYEIQNIILINGEDDQKIEEIGAYPYYKRELVFPTRNFVKPLNFCIPKELIVDKVPTKTKDWATIIPGDKSTYIYTEENSYYEDYKNSYFGVTCKKGGWDCLRHYEILMNGCIPFFPDLPQCPEYTMTRFPKKLVMEACEKIKKGEDLSFYEECVNLLLDWTRDKLTTESVAKEIIS